MAELITKTLARKPKAATHWSVRAIAKETGIAKSTVHRLFQLFGLQPHRTRSFKLSTDPFFIEKLRDVVGLYLNPPDKAVVLCVDEKSQIQALERTQPMLPMGFGYIEGVTHDYQRHGTTTLFAALNVLDGAVIAQCKPRHRHQEFLAFLRHIEANVPAQLDIHLVVDNYATHKHPKVRAWLARRPRWHIHFTPTYTSWLNQVERFFALITQRAIRRGSFTTVKDLVNKIDHFVAHYNNACKPFVWTATADSILAKLARLCERISGTGHYRPAHKTRTQVPSGNESTTFRSAQGLLIRAASWEGSGQCANAGRLEHTGQDRVVGGCVGTGVGESGDVGIGLRYTSHRLLGLPIELELPCLEVGLLRLLAERDAAFQPHLCRLELVVKGAPLGQLRLQLTLELLRCSIAAGFGVVRDDRSRGRDAAYGGSGPQARRLRKSHGSPQASG